MREGIARAAGAGPAQASLGRGWRRTLFSFFDLQQDLEIRNKVEKVESASSFTSTMEEEERKGNKSRDPRTKTRKEHLLFYSIVKGVNGSITCRSWEGMICMTSPQLCNIMFGV